MTLVHKTATAEVADDLTFVLSDATVDRYGDIIEAEGWDLRWFKRNPIALFGHDSSFPIGRWEDVRVEGGKLLGKLVLAAEGTSARIDELRRLVAQKMLRAVSVGFKPVESEPMGTRGVRYKKQELLETSLVSVPANPAALAVARSMRISDDTIRLAFGEHAGAGQAPGRGFPGEHAANPTPKNGTPTMSTLAERIKALQDGLVAKRDRLTDLENADNYDVEAVTELQRQIDHDEAELTARKASEAKLGFQAAEAGNSPAAVSRNTLPAQVRAPLGMSRHAGRPADTFIRAAACNIQALITGKPIEDVIRARYGDEEERGMIGTVAKAAVAGATTTTSGWAAELVNTVTQDFIETLRPASAFPELSMAGGGRLAFGPNAGAIKIPARLSTPSIGASFVGEGGAIPVRRIGVSSQTLTPKKMGVISVFSREIARYSNPAIEALLRREITADTAINIDAVLFDNTAASSVRPAGLLNGATTAAGTAGGDADAFITDLLGMRAVFDAAYAGDGLRLVMTPGRLERLALLSGTDRPIGFANDIIARYNPITTNALADTTVMMIRAADFVSVNGDAEFDLSEETVLHMEDTTPLAIGTAGSPNTVAAPVASMYQTAQIAIRMLMDVNWAMIRSGMVVTRTAVTW